MSSLPLILRIRQEFLPTPPVDIRAALVAEFGRLRPKLKPGMRIAVGVGSRGITHLAEMVVKERIRQLEAE